MPAVFPLSPRRDSLNFRNLGISFDKFEEPLDDVNPAVTGEDISGYLLVLYNPPFWVTAAEEADPFRRLMLQLRNTTRHLMSWSDKKKGL